MIDVQIPSDFNNGTGIKSGPVAAIYRALAVVSKSHGDRRFLDQDFGPGILAIAGGIDPMIPIPTVIGWDVTADGRDREVRDGRGVDRGRGKNRGRRRG